MVSAVSTGVAFQFIFSTTELTFSPASWDQVMPVADRPMSPMKIHAPIVECRRVAFQRLERCGCFFSGAAAFLGRRRIHHM